MSNEQVRFYNPAEDVVKNAAVSGMDGYRALCKEAEDDYEGFWGRRAKELLDWKVPFTQILDQHPDSPYATEARTELDSLKGA